MSILPKITYRFNATSIKIPKLLIILKILKLMWNEKRLQIANTILNKKNKTRGITLSDFKMYDKVIVIKQ